MPERAPVSKVKATRSYGGNVVLHGRDYDAAAEHADELEREEAPDIRPCLRRRESAGRAGDRRTGDYEDLPGVDTVVVPIGGGGLISGIATASNARTSVSASSASGRGSVQRGRIAGEGPPHRA